MISNYRFEISKGKPGGARVAASGAYSRFGQRVEVGACFRKEDRHG
jgi:hypothetical protein